MARPREYHYKEEYCDLLIKHMSGGLSFESFAGLPNVRAHRQILYKWTDEYPEFAQAKKEGVDASLLWWENLGQGAITGQVPGFNAATYIFTMKNKFGWRDKQEIDFQTPKEGFTLNYKSIKDEE